MSNRDLLRYAAERAVSKPFYLASVLRAYQELHGMDDEQLGRQLGCDPSDLPRLGLCRRPDPAPSRFRADVEQVAEHFGLSAIALAGIVREVDATRQLRAGAGLDDAGPLLAARDRERDRESGSAPKETEVAAPSNAENNGEGANSAAPDASRADDGGAHA